MLGALASVRLVRSPGEPDATAHVRLVAGAEPACTGGVVYTGVTDATGALEVHTEACGPVRLIVSRRGKRTVEQHIDTCELRGLEVVLWPSPPPRAPEHPCEETAYAFLRAWAAFDEAGARAWWAGTRDFSGHALAQDAVAPFRIEVEPVALNGDHCRVHSYLSCEQGCESVRVLDLARRSNGWRVTSFEPMADRTE